MVIPCTRDLTPQPDVADRKSWTRPWPQRVPGRPVQVKPPGSRLAALHRTAISMAPCVLRRLSYGPASWGPSGRTFCIGSPYPLISPGDRPQVERTAWANMQAPRTQKRRPGLVPRNASCICRALSGTDHIPISIGRYQRRLSHCITAPGLLSSTPLRAPTIATDRDVVKHPRHDS